MVIDIQALDRNELDISRGCKRRKTNNVRGLWHFSKISKAKSEKLPECPIALSGKLPEIGIFLSN